MFSDRQDAGKKLALILKEYQDDPEGIVIALPRGGVVVGFEVANLLHLPLDIVYPRKIGAPSNPEFAMGAITETGEGIFSFGVIQELGISDDYLKKLIEQEKKVALERLSKYRKGRPPRNLEGKTVILVDDGLATGSTMEAAIKTVKKERAKKVIVAVPVAPPDTVSRIKKEVDELKVLLTPPYFYAVGQFYEHFEQVEDGEVISILQNAAQTMR